MTRRPASTPAVFVRLSASQDAVLTDRGVLLVRGREAWWLNDAEVKNLLGSLTEETAKIGTESGW